MNYNVQIPGFEDSKEVLYMSLSQTVVELGLIIKMVLYLFVRPFGASSIQERLIIAKVR